MAVSAPLVVGPMRMADVAAVLEIERLSFSAPWPAFAFEQELTANRLAHYRVARLGDRVVAFGGIWLMVDEAHITTFGVHPDHRGGESAGASCSSSPMRPSSSGPRG